jgi:signal transduction histidine kinase
VRTGEVDRKSGVAAAAGESHVPLVTALRSLASPRALLWAAVPIAGAIAATGVLTWRRRARHDGKNAPRLRKRDRDILQAFIDQVPVAIAFRSPNGHVLLDNEIHRQILTTMGLEHRPWSEFGESMIAWTDGRAVTKEAWDEIQRAAERAPVERTVVVRTASGTPTVHWAVVAPVHSRSDGRFRGTVTVVRDVSAEHTIRKLREELVAVIAHDLRSPIAAISLSLDQALRHASDPAANVGVPASTLERMRRSARQLGAMVGDLLDASRVELGALSLDREDVDVGAFASELARDLAPSLRGHPVDLDLPTHPVIAPVDRVRLTQVVTNLLDNASKYSRDGSSICLALRDEGDMLRLSVADEGEGIAADDVPQLFDRFFQAKRARQKRSGLGLGLYITKGIVDAHGGTLTVETAPGVGSTFHVRLPRSRRN